MTSASTDSPQHRFTNEYENMYYDTNFTADISNKMRVPSKILVTGEGKEGLDDVGYYGHSAASAAASEAELSQARHKHIMQVPDRIMVAGHEQHVGYKAPPRELHLEQILAPQQSLIRVETPPRVLTLEDHFFPTVDDDENEKLESDRNHEKQGRYNRSDSSDDSPNQVVAQTSLSDSIAASPSEELLALRRHLSKLSRRIVSLEQEAQLRQQRETMAYSFGVAYFVLKALLWLHRHW